MPRLSSATTAATSRGEECREKPGEAAPLVSCTKSHRDTSPSPKRKRGRNPPVTGFDVYAKDVVALRDYGPQPQPEQFKGLERRPISKFSPKAVAHLTQTARNAMPELISQFCLTYHHATPDGRATKKHLDAWLKVLRRLVKRVGYLWILEFQSRGVPHYHVWLTCPYSEGVWKALGTAWNRIAEPESPEHLWWHTEERLDPHTGKVQRSFMAWEMNGAGYLRKYMSKAAQKCVPEGFVGVGRFWGCTRNLAPLMVHVPAEDLPARPQDVTRTLSRYVEARRRRGAAVGRKIAKDKGWKHRPVVLRPTARGVSHSARLNNAAPVFLDLTERLYKVLSNTPKEASSEQKDP